MDIILQDLLVVPHSQSWLRLRGDARRVIYLESLVPGTVGKLEKGNICEGVSGVGGGWALMDITRGESQGTVLMGYSCIRCLCNSFLKW